MFDLMPRYSVFFIGFLLWILAVFIRIESASAESIHVVDYQGREIQLAQPAKRIITLAPHATENMFSIGAGAQIVATVEYSDFPETAKTLPRVGGFNMTSVEKIIAYDPDLVIFWGSGSSQAVLKQLLRLKIPVYIDEPKKLPDIARSLLDFGKLSGHQINAEIRAQYFLRSLKQLKEKHARQQAVSVFYQIWNDPLQTLNGSHITSDLIALCGGENIFADEPGIAPVVSKESVIERNPQVILASGESNERPVWLDDWLAWPDMSAVKNKHLYFISADLIQRHTLRMLEGARQLCTMFDAL